MPAAPRPTRRTAVVVAGFAAAGEGWILRQVQALARAGLPVGSPPRHRPHLSLAAVRLTDDELDRLAAVVDAVAVGLTALDLSLDHLGIFPSGGVLWLAPRPDPRLRAVQARVDAALVESGWRRAFEQHQPDRWVAHITLATRLRPDDLGRATALAGAALAGAARPSLALRMDRLAVILVGGDRELAAVPLT